MTIFITYLFTIMVPTISACVFVHQMTEMFGLFGYGENE